MILIKNIYYMLSYAFENLKEKGFNDFSKEEFDNAADLLASILEKGISYQVKKGINKYYVPKEESLPTLRGKIEMQGTVLNRLNQKRELNCQFDEFSIDTYFNQIVKTTVLKALIPSSQVKSETKKRLKKLMVYFKDVSLIAPNNIDWRLQFDRNNRSYRMLLYICHLILDGMIQNPATGEMRLMDFIDEQHMNKLYEKFILNFYKKERPELKPDASYVPWDTEDGVDPLFLPTMHTDITLSYKDDKLIIDAKYYTKNLQTNRFGKESVHQGNIYQLYAYVKNMAGKASGNVSGLLLYAKTEDELQVSGGDTLKGGHFIGATTLDLSKDFSAIKGRLNQIADSLTNQSTPSVV